MGDLSGIVHDLESDQIIGGNQRIKAMNAEGAQPTITERFDPPTAQGTVAVGYLEYGGERFAYRAVRWTPEQCQRANIVANAAGGDWDWSILAESFDPAMLVDAGLDADALAASNKDAEGIRGLIGGENDLEWDGMPEHISEEIRGTAIECLVRFRTEDDRNAFEKFLGWKLHHKNKTYTTWYPKQDFDQLGRGTEIASES